MGVFLSGWSWSRCDARAGGPAHIGRMEPISAPPPLTRARRPLTRREAAGAGRRSAGGGAARAGGAGRRGDARLQQLDDVGGRLERVGDDVSRRRATRRRPGGRRRGRSRPGRPGRPPSRGAASLWTIRSSVSVVAARMAMVLEVAHGRHGGPEGWVPTSGIRSRFRGPTPYSVRPAERTLHTPPDALLVARPPRLPAAAGPSLPAAEVPPAARGRRARGPRRGAPVRGGARGSCSRRSTTPTTSRACAAASSQRREERALGLPWSPELVERGRRSTQGTVHAARDALEARPRHEPRRRHAPRRRTRRAAATACSTTSSWRSPRCAPRARSAARSSSTATSTRATARPSCSPATRAATRLSLHGGANYPFRRATSDLDVDLPTGTGDDVYLERARGRARRGRPGRPRRPRLLPRRRRPVGGRPPRPPRADEGRAAGARRARPRHRRAHRDAGLRRARRRLRAGRRRHGRDQPRDGARGRGARRRRPDRVETGGHAQATPPRRAPAGAREAEPRPSSDPSRPTAPPNTVATWYVWEDGRVLVNMDEGRKRLEYLRQNPRVSITVLDGDSWYRHITLHGTHHARGRPGPHGHRPDLQALHRQPLRAARPRPRDRLDRGRELARLERRAAVALRPARQTGWPPTSTWPLATSQPQRLVQRVERAVPRRVAEHVAGPVDARGDAAADVLAGRRRRARRPTRRSNSGQSTNSSTGSRPNHAGHPGGQPAQRHRLLGDDVEARPDRGRPGERALEGLRDVVGVHVVQHAEPEVGQRERLAGGQPPPDVGVEVARRRDDRPAGAADVAGMQHDARARRRRASRAAAAPRSPPCRCRTRRRRCAARPR